MNLLVKLMQYHYIVVVIALMLTPALVIDLLMYV